jgi:hypothetical protein
MMVSAWWLVVALMIGGVAGTLVLALMAMASSEQDQGLRTEESIARDDLGSAGLEPTWTVK